MHCAECLFCGWSANGRGASPGEQIGGIVRPALIRARSLGVIRFRVGRCPASCECNAAVISRAVLSTAAERRPVFLTPPLIPSKRISARSWATWSGGGEAGAASEVFADEPDRDGAFANRGGSSLDRAAADVAGREHALRAGLQQVGVAMAACLRRLVTRVWAKRRPGDDVAAVVKPDRSGEPSGVRLGTDQDDESRDRQSFTCLGSEVLG